MPIETFYRAKCNICRAAYKADRAADFPNPSRLSQSVHIRKGQEYFAPFWALAGVIADSRWYMDEVTGDAFCPQHAPREDEEVPERGWDGEPEPMFNQPQTEGVPV